MNRKRRPSFDELSDAAKERIFEECERIGIDDGEPLSAADRAQHRRAGLRPGRPKIGKGAQRINISMERGLLKTADSVAKRRGMTRARLISESVRAYLRKAA